MLEEEILFTMLATLVVLVAIISIILYKLKLPSLIGFIIAGIIFINVEPSDDAAKVMSIFSDLGLLMLMFAIGLGIDVKKLKFEGKFALAIAVVQIPVMLIVGTVTGFALGYSTLQAATLGAVLSGASTAVVLAVLKTSNVLDQERMDILILVMIIEDICQVVMIALLPTMANGDNMSPDRMIVLIGTIILFMGICLTVGVKAVPKFLNWFHERTNDELLALLCIALLFVFAFLSTKIGLSIAIGAFLSGVMIGTARPKPVVERFVNPMKTLFMGMFFISVGAKVSVDILVDNIQMIVVFYLIFAVCMFVAVNIGYRLAKGDSRNGWVSALSMCTMGEFAFIISKQALDLGIFSEAIYSSIVGAAIVSMIILPFLARSAERTYAATHRNHVPADIEAEDAE